MSIEEENKAIINRVYELINQGNWDAYWDELYSPNAVLHMTDRDMSKEQSKKFEYDFLANTTNLNITLNDIVAEGDKVAVLVTWRWNQKDTNKRIEMTNANFFKIAEGKIVEAWNVTDIRLAQQLGAIPKQ
jgi:predicted SnoaL-like aldol condensation-catalyzing enzyme